MGEHIRNHLKTYIKLAIIVLVIALIVLGIFFVHESYVLRKAQIISEIHHGVPLTASDVDIIRPWMTFDYINRIFNVSSSYLQQDLSITDSSYPRVSLSSYATHEHINTTVLMNQVEGALYNKLTTGAN